jgi:LPXTG-motif cell wall-anchored protein
MSITQADLATGVYMFLVMGGMITLVGGLFVYFVKKSKKQYEYK